jgi:biopolymer transport protein ExbD
MEYSAQRVRTKARTAVKRREDDVEQDEMESGELNLVPYLDIVTNLLLFLLASVTAGLILVQIDTTLPDQKPKGAAATDAKPATDPNDQPLKLVLSVTRDKVILWSLSGLEGTVQAPKASFARTGRDGDVCDGSYMCETNKCDLDTRKCVAGKDLPAPVFDYRAINGALFEIANRRYLGKQRKPQTYEAVLQADGDIPYSTIVSVMASMRCKLPDVGQDVVGCYLPTEDEGLKKAADPIAKTKKLYDTDRAAYDPKSMALFHEILFSTGFE